jgi:hypothetical protein
VEKRSPNKVDVVVLALWECGGSDGPIDTEDVAMRAHALAPSAFAWKKYPDQVDLDSVRVTLYDACKPKYGRVHGSVGAGWVLSPVGVEWVRENQDEIRSSLGVTEPRQRIEARSEGRHVGMEMRRLRQSEAFALWSQGESLSPRVAAAAFRIDAYTAPNDRALKVNALLQLAEQAGDEESRRFILGTAETAMSYTAPTVSEPSEGT